MSLILRGYKIYHTIHTDHQAKGDGIVVIQELINHFEEFRYSGIDIESTKQEF